VKAALLFLPALALSGCGDRPEIADCERFLTTKLRSPSTYERISADTKRMTTLNPQEQWVSIEYDAANAYGTPIRGSQICKYPLVDGRPDTSGYINHDSYGLPEDIDGLGTDVEAADQAIAEAERAIAEADASAER
jgi:hypothetical protein